MAEHFSEKPEYGFVNNMPFWEPIQFNISRTGTLLTTLVNIELLTNASSLEFNMKLIGRLAW